MSSKYWSKKVETDTKNESWQEPFSRDTTVSPKSIQALDVLLNFSGSWAAAYADGYSAFVTEGGSKTSEGFPNNPRWRVSKLGQIGFPELNFVPYNYRTNAFGSKGGSLIGHPISLSVIGPTLKSVQEWAWSVSGNSLTFVPSSSSALVNLTEVYGDLSAKLAQDGQLFLVVSEGGAVRSGGAGVNLEGLVFTGNNGLYPKEEYGESAKFEIFRVVAIAGNTITLDPNKLLSDVFEVPAKPQISGVTFFQPYVTRLIAAPNSGDKGAEKVFMVVSPENAAFNDLHLSKHMQNEPLARYGEANQIGQVLPIPIPLKSVSGHLESTDDSPLGKADGAGVFRIYGIPTGHGASEGDVIHITNVEMFNVGEQVFNKKTLLGWFEVLEASATMLQVRREIEVNPNTGIRTVGQNLFLNKGTLPASSEVRLSFTIHEPVSNLFLGDYNADKVESCRLKNLIDPAWVDRTTKQVNDDVAGTLFGGSPARADRSIFTTNTDGTSYSDAGSLLDLGFRMVLFPAKDDGSGNAIPDFSKPITSLETTLDPSITEKQTLSIDYSAGTVTLSHAPARGGTIKPVGIVGESGNNPRGEVVLFAACVPFSMEEGQTGVGVSLTGGELAGADHGFEGINYRSTLGEQIYLETKNATQVKSRNKIPAKGYLSVVSKDGASSPNTNTHWSIKSESPYQEVLAEFGYQSRTLLGTEETKNGIIYNYDLGGLFSTNFAIFDPTLHDFILRKENPNFVSLSEDTSYGSAWRSDSVRFAYADLTANEDGSVTVMPTAVAGPAQELRSLFPLGGDLEIGRVAFNRDTQRWVVSSKPSVPNDLHQVGFEVLRGKSFVSDRNVKRNISSPKPIISLVDQIVPSGSNKVMFNLDTTTITTHAQDLTLLIETGTTNNAFNMKALIEGSSVVSQSLDWATQTFSDHRLVFAIKKYNGTDEYNEAPNNPIHWVSLSIPDGMPIVTILSNLRGLVNTTFGIEPPYAQEYTEGGQSRLMLTERFIDILPSNPYLMSREILVGTPMVFGDDNRFFLTIKSADPNYPERWITLPIQTESLVSSNPLEIAAHLNRPLYDRSHDHYVGRSLSQAGFIRRRSSVNPYLMGGAGYGASTPVLAANDFGERQVLFAAHDDSRHPAHDLSTGTGDPTHPDYNKVILLCGGGGAGENQDTGSTVNAIFEYDSNPQVAFHNVLVEVGVDREDTQNTLNVLGGDFTISTSTIMPRCGLFHISTITGISTDSGSSIRPNIGYYTNDPHRVFAKVNEIFRSVGDVAASCGQLSIAAYLGTYDFDAFSVSLDSFDGVSDRTSPFMDMQRQKVVSPLSSTGVNPNLSKLVLHQKRFIRENLADPTKAGFYGAWVSYTSQKVEPHDFPSPFISVDDIVLENTRGSGVPPRAYRFLIEWDQYERDSISLVGEQIFLKDQGGGASDQVTSNGVVLVERQASAVDIYHREFLAVFQDFEFKTATAISLFVRTQGIFSAIDPNYVNPTRQFIAEFIPSNSAIIQRFRNTMAVRNPNMNFYGGTANIGEFDNVTYMSGGHIDLFSSRGDTNPAGFSLGTVVRDNLSFAFLTHIEQGVFRRGGYGEPDSEPFFSNFNEGKGDTTGASQGSGRGTRSSNSSVKDGVAGVRFSGDTQIWLRNITSLSSAGRKTAAVLRENAPQDLFPSLTPIMELGFSSSTNQSLGYFATQYSKEVFGGHAPHIVSGSQDSIGQLYEQANILLGMTQKDFEAWRRISGEIKYNTVFNQGTVGKIQDDQYLGMVDTLGDVFLTKNLAGKWLVLDLASGEDPPYTHTINEGVWQILQAPVMANGIVHSQKYTDYMATNFQDNGLNNFGGSEKDFVAVLIVRVGRYARPNDTGFKPTQLTVNSSNEFVGYSWSIVDDPVTRQPVYTAEVVETGGEPTGLGKTLNGLTIDPLQMGKPSLPFQLLADQDHIIFNYNNLGNVQEGRLFGVFPMADYKGSIKSTAFFTAAVSPSYFDEKEQVIRGIIRSWSSETLFEDMAERTSKNAFSVDEDGRVQYQQKQRLGLGVVIDGGLGVVHATGFRANPRPIRRDTIGSMTMFGNALYPFTNFNGKKAPIHLASTFDTTEFIDDVFIASPKGSLVFEDARGAEGLVARLKENVFVRQGAYAYVSDLEKYHTYTNDALFPYNSGGVVFKGTGSIIYERPFNALSSNAINPLLAFLGKAPKGGLKGMGVPNSGAYFLLPKGPANVQGSSRGKANWNGGFYGAESTKELTPDSVPLYEFVETLSGKPGTMGMSGFLPNSASWVGSDFDDAGALSANSRAIGGSVYQGYRHAYSRGAGTSFNGATDIQIRLLEGMVVENTTNGTFYTLGETGRHWIESQYYANLEQYLGVTEPIGVGTRSAVQGSRIIRSRNAAGESDLFFDLNPYVGFKNTRPLLDPCWGTGDRTDTFIDGDPTGVGWTPYPPALSGTERTHVRNTVIGHNLRVTANVEFVPILGKYGVDGGLIPALSGTATPQIDGEEIKDADAILYSMSHQFKPASGSHGAGDIGKFIYICGTECYQYTGWWVITDVLEDYLINSVGGSGVGDLRDVAVVRKWQRDNMSEGDPITGFGKLPLGKRSPMLRTTGCFPNDPWYDRNTSSNIELRGSNFAGNTVWSMTVPSADIVANGVTTSSLVTWLNANFNYNGIATYNALKAAFPAVFTQTASPSFISWKLDGIGSTNGASGTIVINYNLSDLLPPEVAFLTGHMATIFGGWQSKDVSATSLSPQTSLNLGDNQELYRFGLFTRKGTNSCLDRGAGDRNNAAPMILVDGAGVNVESYSAARGLRWVFSHPLMEEHTGGYLHLERPVREHFDRDAGGFQSPTADGDADAPFWVSRYPTYEDVESENIRKVDIFRVNRCPSTYNLVVGGDCEIYYRQPLRPRGGATDNAMIYSPLSVDFSCLWQDSDLQKPPTDVRFFDTTDATGSTTYVVNPAKRANRYSLQPVAREKIVAINPTSMESSVIFDESPVMHIESMQYVLAGAGSSADHLTRIVLKNPNPSIGGYYPPQQSLSVGTPIIFRDIVGQGAGSIPSDAIAESFNNNVGYIMEIEDLVVPSGLTTPSDVEHGAIVLKVFTPSITGFPVAFGPNFLTKGYFGISEGLRPYQVEGTDASTPWKLLAKEELTMNQDKQKGFAKMNHDIFAGASPSQAQWYPASKWWQVMNPITYYGYTYDTTTGVEKVVEMNRGDNPNVLRVELTEAFTQAQQSGSGIGSPIFEKKPKGVRLNRIWVNFGLWGNPMTDPLTGSATHTKEATPAFIKDLAEHSELQHQAITFNLIVQIPSVGEPSEVYSGSYNDHINVETSGLGTTPFNGRAPTSTVSEKMSSGLERADLGSYTIPLYVNREAGDLSPNTQERFATHGYYYSSVAGSSHDWVDGDSKYGMGVSSSADAYSYMDITDGTNSDWVANSSNPVVWGGIDTRDFTNQDKTLGNIDNIFVKASVSPRSSIVATSDSDQGRNKFSRNVVAEDYAGSATNLPRSLHPQGVMGVTVSHAASFGTPPKVTTGSRNNYGSENQPHSAPHSFTMALTPIGTKNLKRGNPSGFGDPAVEDASAYGNYLNSDRGGSGLMNPVPFEVGNWLRGISERTNISPSMLPVGARVYLEVTIPHTRRTYDDSIPHTSNGCWLGQVLCSFEVETADGTANSIDINILGDE